MVKETKSKTPRLLRSDVISIRDDAAEYFLRLKAQPQHSLYIAVVGLADIITKLTDILEANNNNGKHTEQLELNLHPDSDGSSGEGYVGLHVEDTGEAQHA